MYDFLITIRQPDYKRINIISRLMLALALVCFVYAAFQYPSFTVYYAIVILAVIACFFYITITFPNKAVAPMYRTVLVIAAAGWLLQPERNLPVCILYLLAALLEQKVKTPQQVGINKDGVSFNAFVRKKVSWAEISNVVLKDGLLTVDYKNNHLFQKQAEEELSAGTEKEFNDFCRSKLSGHIS